MPVPHIRFVAHCVQGSVEQNISDPPSVAITLIVFPEMWVLPLLENVGNGKEGCLKRQRFEGAQAEGHDFIIMCRKNYCKLQVLTARKSWSVSFLGKFLLPHCSTVFDINIKGVD